MRINDSCGQQLLIHHAHRNHMVTEKSMYRARAALERKDSSQNARAVDPERESGWVQYIFFFVTIL